MAKGGEREEPQEASRGFVPRTLLVCETSSPGLQQPALREVLHPRSLASEILPRTVRLAARGVLVVGE